MSVDDTLCEIQKFCNLMVCEGHSRRLKFIEAKYPTRSFYLINRQELRSGLFTYVEKTVQFALTVIKLIVKHVKDFNI